MDEAEKITNRRMRALDRRLQAIYTQAYEDAVAANLSAIEKLASLPDDAPQAQRLAFLREVNRTSGMVDNIAAELARSGEFAAQIIQGEMTGIWDLNYNYSAYDISRQSRLALDFAQYDRNQIAAIISDNSPPFSKIAYRNLGRDAQIVQRLGNELAIGTITGESQAKLIKRIQNVTGQSVRQARTVAQTERTRVQSQGRHMGITEADAMGIVMEKEWSARMVRTRDRHAAANGEVVAADEEFSTGLMYPGDPNSSESTADNIVNCHCIEIPRVRSVSERAGRDNPSFHQVPFQQYYMERHNEYDIAASM